MLKKDEYDNVYVCGAALIGNTDTININTNMNMINTTLYTSVGKLALIGRTQMASWTIFNVVFIT